MTTFEIILLAILLSLITSLLLFLQFRNIERHQASQDPMLLKIKAKLAKLDPKSKKIPMFEGDKSYTLDKKEIFLCLRDEYNNYYDENFLTYVALHEYAHVLCDEIGHTNKFHNIFKQLLNEAIDEGLYDPSKPIINNYCQLKPGSKA